MLLSILIPVYNAGAYLSGLLDSLTSQATDNTEIILLNDGSKDNSLNICLTYQSEFPDLIHVKTRENKGAVRTRRELFEAASGEWIWVIDSDDMISDDAVSSITSFISIHECDMVLFDHYRVSDKGSVYHKQLEMPDLTVFEGDCKQYLYTKITESSSLNTLWNKVFKRSCIDFSEDYSYYEDVIKGNDCLQMIPLLTNARRIIYYQKPLYYYNIINGTGLSHKFSKQTYTSLKKVLERRRAYIRIWDMEEELMPIYTVTTARVALFLFERFAACNPYKEFRDFFHEMVSDNVFPEAIDQANIKSVKKYQRSFLKQAKKRRPAPLFFLIRLSGAARSIKNLFK